MLICIYSLPHSSLHRKGVKLSKKEFVIEQITEMIKGGEYPPGEQLPSEPHMEKLFNVSRGTIRQALTELAQAGVVARRSGSGTFVLRDLAKEPKVIAFHKQVKNAGMEPSTKVLEAIRMKASELPEQVWRAFLVPEAEIDSTFIYRINRLRCGNDIPLARQIIYLLAEDFQSDLLETEDFSQSAFELYGRYHRKVSIAEERIQARLATPAEIELFQLQSKLREQQMVYVRERISYDQQNMPLEVMTSIDRGDFFTGYRYRITESDLFVDKAIKLR